MDPGETWRDEEESAGFQVRDENSAEAMDGKVTVDINPIGQGIGPLLGDKIAPS